MSEQSKGIRLFSNGEEYLTWRHNNCSKCVKEPDCPLEYAISSACVLDGTISPAIAGRLGVPDDGRERWWCRERLTADQQPSVPPAQHEVKAAGAAMLPGLEDVPARPERGRPSWTA